MASAQRRGISREPGTPPTNANELTSPRAGAGTTPPVGGDTRVSSRKLGGSGLQRIRRPSRLFIHLLQLVLGSYLKLRLNVRFRNRALFRRLKPPYLVVANHVGFWDPFILSAIVPHPIYWVTADANFRSPVLRAALRLVGAIPKTKAMSDFDTVRMMVEIKRAGGVLGVFPEGRRTWDGLTLPVVPATAKLIRLLRIPVVAARFEGGYFTHPRWSPRMRRGILRVRLELGFSAEQLSRMPTGEVVERLERLIEHNEYEAAPRTTYGSRAPARGIERVLFACARCGAIGAIRSARHTARCDVCGLTVQCTGDGQLLPLAEGGNVPPTPRSILEWNHTQHEMLRCLIEEAVAERRAEPLFSDGPLRFMIGRKSDPLVTLGYGRLICYGDCLEFRGFRFRPQRPGRRYPRAPIRNADGSWSLVFSLSELEGTNVQNRERLEWYADSVLYHVRDPYERTSALKWLSAVNLLRRAGAASGR